MLLTYLPHIIGGVLGLAFVMAFVFGLVILVVWLARRNRKPAEPPVVEPPAAYFDPYAPSPQELAQMAALVRKAKTTKAELETVELMKNAVTYAGK